MAKEFFSKNNRPLHLGDEVIIDPTIAPEYIGKVFKVDHFKVKYVAVKPVDGGQGIRIDPAYLIHAVEANGTYEDIPFDTRLPLGTIVKANERLSRHLKLAADTLLVVTNQSYSRGRTVHQLAYLGGDDKDDTYFSKVLASELTVVPLNKLHEETA